MVNGLVIESRVREGFVIRAPRARALTCRKKDDAPDSGASWCGEYRCQNRSSGSAGTALPDVFALLLSTLLPLVAMTGPAKEGRFLRRRLLDHTGADAGPARKIPPRLVRR